MKKVIYLLVPVLLIIAMGSCSKKHKSAGESAKEYSERIKNQDYDGFIEYVFIDEIPDMKMDEKSPEMKAQKVQHAKALKSNVEPYMQRNGGLKNVNVKSENVASDGKTANVTLTHEYNNGQAEDVTYHMVLVDNDWKVKVGNNREVWRTKLADGTDLSFTLKENDHKEVFKEHMGDERDFIKEKASDGKYVEKVKEDGSKEVLKVKDKGDEIIVKEKVDGEKKVEKIEKK